MYVSTRACVYGAYIYIYVYSIVFIYEVSHTTSYNTHTHTILNIIFDNSLFVKILKLTHCPNKKNVKKC